MVNQRRTGYALRRAPTSIRNRRVPTNLQTTNPNAALQMATRNDLLLEPPALPTRPAPDTEIQEENHHYHEFHQQDQVEPQASQSTLLPPEFVTQYAQRREKLENAWKSVEKSMTASFYTCQYQTKNWTSSMYYLEPLDECVCTTRVQRKVDLIHTHDRYPEHEIEFCSCIPDAIRLIHHGYIAASPTKPRTAFSIPLVQLYQSLWHESAVPYTSFIKGLVLHQDTRSYKHLTTRSHNNNPRDLRIPFSQAMDIFGRIEIIHKELLHLALELKSPDLWASKCPSCFGPEAPDEASQAGKAYAIIAMDGNFQHRHHHFASTDVPSESDYPSIFVPPSRIDKYETQIASTNHEAAGVKSSCSDAHKAANDVRNSTSWDKFDDTGLFGSCCRHDIPLKLSNIEGTGEKLYYPVSILEEILKAFPTKKIGLLYDIGCHLDAHIKKRKLLGNRINDVMFGTSVFHAYVHNWACQIQYNPRYNLNWGLSDGEGMERLWSQLSGLVGPLRSSTRTHRLQAIGRQCTYYNEKLKYGAADWIHRHLLQARKSMEECQTKLEEIYSRFNHFSDENYSPQFFEEQWLLERSYYQDRNQLKEQQKIELGRLLTLEQDLVEAWEHIQEPEDSLARIRTLMDIQQKIEQQRERIGSESEVFVAGFTPEAKNIFLKVWWAKTELRQKFLALKEEKRPLDAVRKGLSSKLGTDGKERLIISIRKRTAALQTVVNTYNRHLASFHEAFPQRATTAQAVEYDALMRMEADDSFWNDGVFTNHDEPWAVDPDTQDGMRLLARHRRGEEEVQRISQELRKAMRWVVTEHSRIVPLMFGLSSQMDWATTRLQPVMDHPILQSLSPDDQLDSLKAIIHNHFVELCSLQLHWNSKMVFLISDTGPYQNDNQLLNEWNHQVVRLTYLKASGYLSMIAGDFDNSIGNTLENVNEEVLQNFLTQNMDTTSAPTNTQDEDRDINDVDTNILPPGFNDTDQFEHILEQQAINTAYDDDVEI